MSKKIKRLTRKEFELAAKECAAAGCDPSKSWNELTPQAQAALKKHQAKMIEFLFGVPKLN